MSTLSVCVSLSHTHTLSHTLTHTNPRTHPLTPDHRYFNGGSSSTNASGQGGGRDEPGDGRGDSIAGAPGRTPFSKLSSFKFRRELGRGVRCVQALLCRMRVCLYLSLSLSHTHTHTCALIDTNPPLSLFLSLSLHLNLRLSFRLLVACFSPKPRPMAPYTR